MGNEAGEAAAEGAEPQDPVVDTQPQNTGEGEGAKPQDPEPAEGKNTPNVNVHKLERDVANRDKRIAELEAQLKAKDDEGAGYESRLAELEKSFAASKEEAAKAKADAALTKAGCVDCELGRTALAAFDGDVEKLVEAKPFLFKAQGQMGTGGRQAGTADAAAKSIKEALRQTNR
ncbi:hypothetical protein [Olsenella uli]|uniref:hypothetical protein n=1 Tax=Olsenella uli TaxID=133926 RepID=UPI003D7A2B2B